MTLINRLAPESFASDAVLPEQTRRQTILAAQLNAHPAIQKLGVVEVHERWPGRTELLFRAGEYDHCINAAFYEADAHKVQWQIIMVTRTSRYGKKFHEVSMVSATEIHADGLALIAKQLKSGLARYKKNMATAEAVKASNALVFT